VKRRRIVDVLAGGLVGLLLGGWLGGLVACGAGLVCTVDGRWGRPAVGVLAAACVGAAMMLSALSAPDTAGTFARDTRPADVLGLAGALLLIATLPGALRGARAAASACDDDAVPREELP
jgi:hypothetical protein